MTLSFRVRSLQSIAIVLTAISDVECLALQLLCAHLLLVVISNEL